jgi:esterase/lipase superfamily enzyme
MPAAQPSRPDEPSITLSINGLVIDEIGEPVTGATVTVLHNSSPLSSESSNVDGQVHFPQLKLKIGIHTLRAAKPGYEVEEQELIVNDEMDNATRFTVFRLDEIETPIKQLQPQKQPPKSIITMTKGSAPVLREPTSIGAEDRPADRMGAPKEVKPGRAEPPVADQPEATVEVSEDRKYYRVRVYFATDRMQLAPTSVLGLKRPDKAFGNDRSPDSTLSLGLCQVSIPKAHRIGQIEAPSIFSLEFKADPVKHIVILQLRHMRETYFLDSVGMMAAKSPDQSALVFIHGYNVTFAEAVRRTAQLAFDLDFQGVPICYSWPSTGKYSGYMADEASVEWTIPHLMDFLSKIAHLKDLKTIHLIAHSMGNRALVNCLSRIAQRAQLEESRPHFHQTILAAPDIDAGVFKQLAQSFNKMAIRTTLYASSHDLALQISQQFHRYPRAGESGSAIVVVPQVDTVDVSEVPSGFLGHSYYGDSRSVLTDVYQLLKSGAPPPRFGLRKSEDTEGTYWIFAP